MKKNFLFQLLLAAFLLPAFSCSDDDSAPEINNATTLNMLDVENGATRLGNSDIYINDAGNFVSGGDCSLFMLGEASGLGAVRIASLRNPVPEAKWQCRSHRKSLMRITITKRLQSFQKRGIL